MIKRYLKKAIFYLVLISSFLFILNFSFAGDYKNKHLGDEVIYQVVLDRLHDGQPFNNYFSDDHPALFDPAREIMSARFGGDIDGLIEKLPYLSDLGITMIWISPIIKNDNAIIYEEKGGKMIPITNYHGYWGTDWYKMDPHLIGLQETGFEALARLVRKAGMYGIKIIVDTVINHSSNYFNAKGSVYEKGRFKTNVTLDREKSPAKQWYHHKGEIDWSGDFDAELDQNIHDKGIDEAYDFQGYSHRLASLADFNLQNDEVMDYFIKAHKEMLKTGIAGFRVDTVKHIHPHILAEFERELRKDFPDTIFIGEWFGGGPANLVSLERYYYITGFTMFNFSLRTVFEQAFADKERHFSYFFDMYWDRFERMNKKGFDPNDIVNFVDNHDLPRLRNRGATKEAVTAAMAMMIVMPGVPCFYYGIEHDLFDYDYRNGFFGIGGDPYNRSLLFNPDGSLTNKDPKLYEKTKELISLRKKFELFRYGSFDILEPEMDLECEMDETIILTREYKGDTAIFFVNVDEKNCGVKLNLDSIGLDPGTLKAASYSGSGAKKKVLMRKIKESGESIISLDLAPFDYLALVFSK